MDPRSRRTRAPRGGAASVVADATAAVAFPRAAPPPRPAATVSRPRPGTTRPPGPRPRPFGPSSSCLGARRRASTAACAAACTTRTPTIRVSGTPAAPITITSYPGEWATLYGRLSVEDSVTRVAVQHMTLDGAGGAERRIRASCRARRCTATASPSSPTRSRTGIPRSASRSATSPTGAPTTSRSVGNRIHDCGVLPPTNHQHGIYLHSPSGAQVTDNWIHDNADTGVNLFPNADGNYFARNVIYGNGDNISFAGRAKDGVCESSDNNLVENNVLSHPRVRKNITSWSSCGIDGIGNILRAQLHLSGDVRGPTVSARSQPVRRAALRGRRERRLPDRAGTPCAPLRGPPGSGDRAAAGARTPPGRSADRSAVRRLAGSAAGGKPAAGAAPAP